jgi:hypothetical protein
MIRRGAARYNSQTGKWEWGETEGVGSTVSAAGCGEYRQPEFLEWCLTRLDGAGPDTPWYRELGPHESLFPLRAAMHC